MKTLQRLFLMVMFAVVALPLVILAQGSDPFPPAQPYYGELIEYPGTGSGDTKGKLLTTTEDDDLLVPLVPSNNSSSVDDLEIPMPNTGSQPTSPDDDLEIPMPNTGNNSGGIVVVPAQSPTPELYDYPTEVVPPLGPDDIPDVPTITPQSPAQPIKLIRGFYKQVGEPKITTTGTCFDESVDAKGSCAADAQGSNEVHDFHNCWSNDPNSPNNPNNKPYDGLEPVCQSADSESLYVFNPSQFYGRLTGSAYGIGSTDRQMLQQGGVSIGTYGVVVGTQVEVLSPSKFVVKYVHREQGGCTRTVSIYYELSGGKSEAACQQVIEVPEERKENPISTPPPLPPIEDDAPYAVALPVMPAECTADNRPPEAFKDTKVKLNEGAGTLSIDYGAGSYTAFQNFGSNFSFVDQRTNTFRLNFTVFGDKISFHWYKTDANGAACSLDGELRPGTSDMIQTNTEASAVKNSPYKAEWKPIEAFCTPETIAKLPNFTQATIKGSQDTFTIDYGTGSYPLTRQMGSDTYFYQSIAEDGSIVTVSLNSYTPEKFALLYQFSDAAGNMCMADLDLTS